MVPGHCTYRILSRWRLRIKQVESNCLTIGTRLNCVRSFSTTVQCAARPTLSRPAQRNGASAAKQRPRKGDAKQPSKLEPSEREKGSSLQWGPETMKPSRALQERLKGIQQPTSQLIDALPDEKPPEPIPFLDNQIGSVGSLASAEAVELQHMKVGNLQIKSAEYCSSSVKLAQCPAPTQPEIAIIGRSNVGKSSLINMLTGRKELALVSKTPGKTKCINHFLMNKSWYLVDLPGYGYAKTSKASRLEWGSFTQEFFKKRHNLINVLLLIDASVPVQNIDLGCAEWLHEHEVPFSLVFTKIDKRKKRVPSPPENIANFEKELHAIMGHLPVTLTTSSTDNLGRQDLLIYLAQLRELTKRSQGIEQ